VKDDGHESAPPPGPPPLRRRRAPLSRSYFVVVGWFNGMGAVSSRALRYGNYARLKAFVRRFSFGSFHRFLGDAYREIIQRPSVVLHGTLGCYVQDAS
jgi:hypothetical protein